MPGFEAAQRKDYDGFEGGNLGGVVHAQFSGPQWLKPHH
jgi:hypothetical protein